MRVLPVFLIAFLLTGPGSSQPRLTTDASDSYRPGQRIYPATWVVTGSQERVRLLDLIDRATRVAVVIFFGGASAAPEADQFRTRLWCEDSFDDMAVQRALVHAFREQPVQFVPVALPPVFHSERFGYGDDTFLGQPAESTQYREAVARFIELTERERLRDVIPFEQIYYDPRFRATQNKSRRKLGPEYGPVEPWQGRFRWYLDARRYGTPTIWLLDASGKVLSEPFIGNDYDSDPPVVNYGFADLKAAIDQLLH